METFAVLPVKTFGRAKQRLAEAVAAGERSELAEAMVRDVLAAPGAIQPSFGPGSFARHAARARATGAAVRVADVPTLGLDVDTPDDLAALHAALGRRRHGAARTRAVLARLLPATATAG